MFAAPGIVHRLGNAMFTIQGQAQLLGSVGPEARERRSILNASERAGRTLALMRALLGHHHDQPEDASTLVAMVCEVLGIAVREGGHTISARLPDDGEFRGVDPGMFYPAVLEAIRLLVAALPVGQPGNIELQLGDGERGQVVVRVRYAARRGSLPFPLATEAIDADLERALRPMPSRPTVRIVDRGFDDRGFDLVFGGIEVLGAGAEP
ncbi:MAG: hypothetical protein KDC98_20205 [Planctomycetes bacterium]|nr:hypothetical protein [Planctomycetota bacterium]